ncbi:MAG TPA: hypothetical protein VGH33_08665, partial [Isosphaeraceae bacterium]
MTKASLAILAAVLVMAPASAWLIIRESPQPDAEAAGFALVGRCRPEPGERRAFIACALGLPPLVFAAAFALRRLRLGARADELTGLALLGLAGATAVVGVANERGTLLLMNGLY